MYDLDSLHELGRLMAREQEASGFISASIAIEQMVTVRTAAEGDIKP